MAKSRAQHRAVRTTKALPVGGAASIAAAAGAALVGMTPSLAMSPQVANTATVWYLRGTNIGDNPSDADYVKFVDRMLVGSKSPTGTDTKVDYPASFWPVSGGGLSDPTFDQSVAQGLAALEKDKPQSGDVIYGYSQGAVVASEYKAAHPGQTDVTYVLVENPDRPNGGILERFNGVSIPILGVTANGATPSAGGHTVDISRQYDGWSDFPAYPLNVLADANAIAGIYYLHGKTQTDVTSQDLVDAKASGNPMYYQKDGNTEYYLIPTDELPILMPFNGIVPKPILDAADPPLRVLVELGYDRSDYGKPTTAGIAPVVNPVTVASNLATATVQGVEKGLSEAGVSVPSGVTGISTQQVATKSKAPSLPVGLGAKSSPAAQSTTPKPSKPAAPKVKAPSLKDVAKAASNAVNKLAAPKHERPSHERDKSADS